MKTRLIGAAFAVAFAIAAFGGTALADQPGNESNPNQQAAHSNNCIAFFSAQVKHNGLHTGETLGVGNNASGNDYTSHGQRGDEIKELQANCGAQR